MKNHTAASMKTATASSRSSESGNTRKRHSSWRSWRLELLSFLLAAASFAAIIAILKTQDGKPLPQWPKYITINALVSIFTSILKAALMLPIAEAIGEWRWIWFSKARPLSHINFLDEASKGPWGSLELLFRGPRAILPAIGAVITICALAIDPFSQQVLQYYNCLEPSAGAVATITRSNNYTISDPKANAFNYVIDSLMAGTIFEGVLNSVVNATSGISTSCTSGNCTFPSQREFTYHSLAICSEVTDISSQITTWLNGTEDASDNLYWAYQLPSGLRISGPNHAQIFLSGMSTALSAYNHSTNTPLFEFEVLTITFPNDSVHRPLAFKAQLFPCVQEYTNVNISNSILEEEIISSIRLPYLTNNTDGIFSIAGDYAASYNDDCSTSTTVTETHFVPAYQINGTDDYATDGSLLSLFDTLPVYYPTACTYLFGMGPTNAIYLTLTGLFGQAMSPYAGSPNNLTWPYDSPYSSLSGDLWLRNIYQAGKADIATATAFVTGLANTMTAAVRARGEGAAAQGTVSLMQTCLHVEWAWISLNAALLAFTALFLGAVIWQSRRVVAREQDFTRGVWKSSSLPLLWSGLDETDRAKFSQVFTIDDMEQRSVDLQVKLSRRVDGKGIVLTTE